MKFVVNRLRLGDEVRARIEEIPSEDHLIINFQGDLVRVTNHTDRPFQVGDEIRLRVSAIDPLEFQIATAASPGRSRGLNVSI